MAKSTSQPKCFIIMPITTPRELIPMYKDDGEHFTHVLEHLFIPALTEAGFEPISPKAEGSNVIHADLIKHLSECELVLCDMSILNPNVFFEFGIRTALDKPVALVVDEQTKSKVPFDTHIINFHVYDSLVAPWTVEEQKKELAKHVRNAYEKSTDRNALWKTFGVAQTGAFRPEQVEVGEKIDFVMNRLSGIETQLNDLQTSKSWEQFYYGLSPQRTQSFIAGGPQHGYGESDRAASWMDISGRLDDTLRFLKDLKSEKDKSQQQKPSPENNQDGKSEAASE